MTELEKLRQENENLKLELYETQTVVGKVKEERDALKENLEDEIDAAIKSTTRVLLSENVLLRKFVSDALKENLNLKAENKRLREVKGVKKWDSEDDI